MQIKGVAKNTEEEKGSSAKNLFGMAWQSQASIRGNNLGPKWKRKGGGDTLAKWNAGRDDTR